ncbi:MAG: aminopeptidase P N-terminal domain-containing protein [Sandaracinaceae bacterium]|nr:aminopeptidase P N-terminal domain-containing protein [Sandaracinaceae bacterium]MBP7684679.1 aminopeptidase P N-terminal domain-containing protein [Deltaproteobacteria bacterium]MBK6810260.1 aminopeptidase P N-terminal domain-containing protein [Sandaracinaceae bacterium]MBK7153194.1 aminopeptidase P N-terminal domain-containing protein [Sandaracinaceae bacterium]MBK7775134.1 aminopeptidase P N-terminal domain-containing protein [Sandaracinaceae bacterium]
MFDPSVYAARRKALLDRIGRGVVVLPSVPLATRNSDVEHAHRQHSDVYYLSGFDEPDAVLVLSNVHAEHQAVLFVRPKNREREIWDGFRHGVEGAVGTFGVDAAFPVSELEQRLPDYLEGAGRLHHELGEHTEFDGQVLRALHLVRMRCRRDGRTTPTEIVSTQVSIHEMRLVKQESELALMRRANAITTEGHLAAMRAARPGGFEYEVEAELLRAFRGGGAERPAYDSIVGSGPNATVLHYRRNDRQMRDGDLLLIDAGCEYGYYAADVTRTFPVNGTFSPAQRELYEVVLAAQDACIAAVRPGATMDGVHQVAVRVLTEGMVRVGLLKGDVDAAIESGAYREFYMHRTSHWLGMDVHDVGSTFLNGAPRPFAPGHVLTIEPGLYVALDATVDERFRGIGIRIEDDVAVTLDGHENLTTVPKTVADVEAAVRGAR